MEGIEEENCKRMWKTWKGKLVFLDGHRVQINFPAERKKPNERGKKIDYNEDLLSMATAGYYPQPLFTMNRSDISEGRKDSAH